MYPTHQYTVPLFWKLAVDVLVLLCITFFVTILFFYFMEEGATDVFLYIMCPFFAPLILLSAGLALYVHTQVVLIDSEKITLRSFFKTRALNISDIQSYSINDYYIILHPNDHSLNILSILKVTGHQSAVAKWIKSRFPERTDFLSQQEEADVISDFQYGYTEEQRIGALRIASIQAWTLNILSTVTALWIIYDPLCSPVVYTVSFLIVPVSVFLLFINDGLVRLIGISGNIILAICMSCMAGGMIGLHLNILTYSNLFLLSLLLSAVLFTLLLSANSREKIPESNTNARSEYVLLFLFLFPYSFGLLAFVNQYGDESKPEIYTSRVYTKDIHTSKVVFKSYSLHLTPWNGQADSLETSVSPDEYEQFSIGETVQIIQRPGCLEATWFAVVKQMPESDN